MDDKDIIINELKTIIEQQASEIAELKKELSRYINPNILSSNKHLKPNTQGLKSKGTKRGAPFGHKGATRKQTPT